MALPSILRNSHPSVSDQLADLQARVNAQGLEIARLSREVGALRAERGANTVATNGPVPASAEDAQSGRALMRLIAVRLGRNEDSVRATLTRHAKFERVRQQSAEAGMPITRNLPFLRWLADNLDAAWPA